MSYEYKIVPAPVQGLKGKGLKTVEDRFANALESAINALAADGWEYLRADTLPCEKREGLMGKTTVFQNLLVFRRAKTGAAAKGGRAEPQVKAPAPKPVQEPVSEAVAPTEKADDSAPAEIDKSGKKNSPDVAAE